MQTIGVLQVAFLLASQIAIIPSPQPESPNTVDDLLERGNLRSVLCGPPDDQQLWSLQSVQDAYNALKKNDAHPKSAKPAAGTRVYPRKYGKNHNNPRDESVVTALDAIPECVTGQANMKHFEFPLTNPVFTHGPRGSQGPDRVVAIAPNPGQCKPRTFTYCLAITHRGQPEGSFTPCTDAPTTDLSLAPQD